MDVAKWIGSWNYFDEEKDGNQKINAEIEVGIIPAVIILGLLVFGIYQLLK